MTCPLIGTPYRIDYGTMAFAYDLHDESKLTFTGESGDLAGHAETVTITLATIRDDVFALAFTDSADARVMTVLDVTNRTVNTFVAMPGQDIIEMTGTLTL